MERLDPDALRSLYRAEAGGKDFYDALAERIGNDEAAELLRRNGTEEAGHARRVARAIGILEGSPFVPTEEPQGRPPIELPAVIDPGILVGLVEGELNGDVVYQRWADNEPNPDVERLLRLNGREEALHGGRVEQVLALIGARPA